MTWKLLQLAFPIVFIGIAFHFYRSHRALLRYFRERMAVSPSGRRFIVLSAMLTLTVYHFVAVCGTAKPLYLLPSSILVLPMFSQKCGEDILRFFQRKKLQLALFVIMLAMFFLPGTTPLAVTMMVLLIASWVYPTEQLMKEVSERGDTPDFVEEVIEDICEDMVKVNPHICFMDEEDGEMVSDTDCETTYEEVSTESNVDDDMADDSPATHQLSERAIHNQKMREKERERRHNRAKRRARRAKHGR